MAARGRVCSLVAGAREGKGAECEGVAADGLGRCGQAADVQCAGARWGTDAHWGRTGCLRRARERTFPTLAFLLFDSILFLSFLLPFLSLVLVTYLQYITRSPPPLHVIPSVNCLMY
jgi:hypothetical protein